MSKWSEEFARTNKTTGRIKKNTKELVKDNIELGKYFHFWIKKKVKGKNGR